MRLDNGVVILYHPTSDKLAVILINAQIAT